MEGILETQGSQDISPPKDTGEAALPAQAPEAANANSEQPAAAAAPEDASPILEIETEAALAEEAGQALDPEASILFKMTIHAKAVGEGPQLRQAQVYSTPCERMLDASPAALHCIMLLSFSAPCISSSSPPRGWHKRGLLCVLSSLSACRQQ